MKKQINLIFLSIFILVLGTSCHTRSLVLRGSGPINSSTPAVGPFNSVSISVPMNATIVLQDGAVPSIKINGYQNLLDHIRMKVENNTLIIYTNSKWGISFGENNNMTAQITMPKIYGLSLQGSPDVLIHGTIACDSFQLDIAGSSTVTIDSINTNGFATSIAGSADVNVNSGVVKYAEYDISGSGSIKAFPVQTDEVSASIAGSGEGEFTAIQKLSSSISGSGDIKYKGHPSVSQEVSGSGSISDAN